MEDFNLTDEEYGQFREAIDNPGQPNEALQKLLATEPPWIETETDYEAALKRIEALMDAEPGTPEEDEHYAIGLADEAEANLDKMVPFTQEMLDSAMDLIPEEISIEDAAKILNTSPEWVRGLIKKGELACPSEGMLERLDVSNYKKHRDAKRRSTLDELTQIAEEGGLLWE